MDTAPDSIHIDLRFRHNGINRVIFHGSDNPTTVNIPNISSQLITPTRILVTDSSGNVGSGNFPANSYIVTDTNGIPTALAPGAGFLVGTSSTGMPTAITIGSGLALINGELMASGSSGSPTFTQGFAIDDPTSTIPQNISAPTSPYKFAVISAPNILSGQVAGSIGTNVDKTYQFFIRAVRRSSDFSDGIRITSYYVRNVDGIVSFALTTSNMDNESGTANYTLQPAGSDVNIQINESGDWTFAIEIIETP